MSNITTIQKEIARFYDEPHENKIKVMSIRQGVGKTKMLENYCIQK